ncbi:MAG: hypothetical protein ACPGYL_10300, partial [Rhodospirillaceae bacterium]
MDDQSFDVSLSSNTAPEQGATPSVIRIDSTDGSAPNTSPDSIDIGDPALLIQGDYQRDGPDLLITGPDGTSVLIENFFTLDPPPALTADSDAIQLDGDLVTRLAGPDAPGQLAQAGAASGLGDTIGAVNKVTGTVTVTRLDGTEVTLQVDDPVYQGDIVVTGGGAAVGITFK